LKTLFVEGGHVREDPFCDYYTGVEDATGLSDLKVSRKDSGEASGLFNEMQQALNQVSLNSPFWYYPCDCFSFLTSFLLSM